MTQLQTQVATPPPEVLIAWLTYIFQTTGIWPMPPHAQPVAQQTNALPTTSPAASTPPVPVQGELGAVTGGIPLVAYQQPLPGWIPFMPVAPEPEKKIKQGATGYKYLDSPYYLTAKSLIADHAEIQIDPALLVGSTLVLSLILAWCNFPLFREGNGREGRWMTLGFDKCCRELKMRSANVKACLTELQRAGLVLPGRVATGIISQEDWLRLRNDVAELGQHLGGGSKGFWHSRNMQQSTNIYLLKVFPTEILPEFNPFRQADGAGKHHVGTSQAPETPCTHVVGGETGEGETRKHHVPTSETPHGVDMVFPGEEPVPTCMYEHMNECMTGGTVEEEKETIKSNEIPTSATKTVNAATQAQIDKAIKDMNPIQRAKYIFLHEEAQFNGFQTDDGKVTLDQIVCNGFAYDNKLTLEQVQGIYDQVREQWSTGQIKKTPLGLLQRMLKAATVKEQRDGEPSVSQSVRRGRRRSTLASNGKASPEDPPAAETDQDDGGWHFR
ncbi:MAG: hypothetical protein WCS37_10410 [Chloroflexota bacterium]